MSKALFTIGYEGVCIDDFISNLHVNNIEYIIDVRALPLSRKPGFSKNQLAKKLQSEDIQYIHLGDLGTPKDIREELKATRDYTKFFKKMEKYLSDKQEVIKVAYDHAMNSTCCLMCFEKFATQCHRKIIAEKIKATNGNGLQIKHI
ncbi:MAG: DUF488 domain-containing protein [Sedimentisphaerales bacterium]|nr:DUF488 domain-containing protein [Sedimentisphaerales bacterium]